MHLHIREIVFKPTFLFLLYLSYTLGALCFALLFIFAADDYLTEIAYALLIFFAGTPVLIAISIKVLNLFLSMLPWDITIIAQNTDALGNVIATSRHINTIRRERSPDKNIERAALESSEPSSEVFPETDGINKDGSKLYGEVDVFDQQDNKRKSSDEYKAATDRNTRNNRPSHESSAEYRAVTDKQAKVSKEPDHESSASYKADTDVVAHNKERMQATTDRTEKDADQ